MGFSLFSSSSSSPTNTSTSDNRIGADNGAIVAKDNAVVNYLSDEALQQALKFAGDEGEGSRNLIEKVYSKAFETFVTTTGKSFDSAMSAQSTALESQRSEGLQGFKQLLIAGVAVAAILAVGGGAIVYFKGKYA